MTTKIIIACSLSSGMSNIIMNAKKAIVLALGTILCNPTDQDDNVPIISVRSQITREAKDLLKEMVDAYGCDILFLEMQEDDDPSIDTMMLKPDALF